MSAQVYGCNHVAIEVDAVEKAVAFYQDVFNLRKLDEGEGDAFFKLGAHQFLAIFKVEEMKPDRMRHFGIMVKDETQLAEAREKITKKYGLKLIPLPPHPALSPIRWGESDRKPGEGPAVSEVVLEISPGCLSK